VQLVTANGSGSQLPAVTTEAAACNRNARRSSRLAASNVYLCFFPRHPVFLAAPAAVTAVVIALVTAVVTALVTAVVTAVATAVVTAVVTVSVKAPNRPQTPAGVLLEH
jgi:hypothetical protein